MIPISDSRTTVHRHVQSSIYYTLFASGGVDDDDMMNDLDGSFSELVSYWERFKSTSGFQFLCALCSPFPAAASNLRVVTLRLVFASSIIIGINIGTSTTHVLAAFYDLAACHNDRIPIRGGRRWWLMASKA